MTVTKDLDKVSHDPPARIPLATAKHLSRAAQLGVGLLLAGLLPERAWWSLAHALARLKVALRHGYTKRRFGRLEAIFGPRLPAAGRRGIVVESFAHGTVAHLQRLRENWPAAWCPRVSVVGGEHVEAGLAGGRGVVLWVSRFVYSDLVTKKGLHQAGLAVHHVSRPSHGFTGSRLAEGFLDPFWLAPEVRYLAERIVITSDGGAAASRAMRRRLKANGIVSITMGHVGRKWCLVPFLEGWVIQATGPTNLALSAGAPLLPVFTTRTAEGHFEVHIEAPLAVPAADERDARFEAMAREMMRRLEVRALAEPSQFMYWRGRFEPLRIDFHALDSLQERD